MGERFYLNAGSGRVSQDVRQEMLDEMMYKLAALLPAEYRGEYADLERASENHIRSI